MSPDAYIPHGKINIGYGHVMYIPPIVEERNSHALPTSKAATTRTHTAKRPARREKPLAALRDCSDVPSSQHEPVIKQESLQRHFGERKGSE